MANSNVLVYGAGDRQVPTVNYTISSAANTITFLSPLTAGESIVFDLVSAPPPPIAPVQIAGGIVVASLYYNATAGQEVFYLATPDKFNNVGVMTAKGALVSRNGMRLVPADSCTIDVVNNRVLLAYPAAVGESVIIDLVA